MNRILRTITGLLGTIGLALALAAAPASAQDAGGGAVVGDAEIGAALDGHTASEAADRAVVERVLATDEAEAAAESLGVDAERVQDAVRVLEGERLSTAASYARTIEDQLAGGQTISFNAITLIIILLLVIIVVLIAD